MDSKISKMFKDLVFALFLVFVAGTIHANDGHHIEFELSDYDSDTLVIGYYMGEQTLVLDTLISEKQKFILAGDESLDPGVYLFLVKPDNQFAQFMIPKDDQSFTVEASTLKLGELSFKGSDENTLFYDYLKFLSDQRKESDGLMNKKEMLQGDSIAVQAIESQIVQIDQSVKDKQAQIVKEHPVTLTAMMIRSNQQVDLPKFEGTEEEVQAKNFRYYKEHYFDNIDLKSPITIRTPYFHKRVDYFMNKLTVQHPDSVNVSIDRFMTMIQENEEAYKYYSSHFLNTAASSKIVGFDAVYVHVVEKYYSDGQADWVEEKQLKKIVNNARRLKPTLIGKPAPKFTIYLEDETPLALDDIETDYTILFFWSPTCGFCKKAIPYLNEFNEEFADQSATILTICDKTGDDYASCWESIKEKGMENLLNAGDKTHKSRIRSKYYVRNTPKIFILDKNKDIIMKGIGAPQLKEVMTNILKVDQERAAGEK